MTDTLEIINPFEMEVNETRFGIVYIKSMEVRAKTNGSGDFVNGEGYVDGMTYPLKVWEENLISRIKGHKIVIGEFKKQLYKEQVQLCVTDISVASPEGISEEYFFAKIPMQKIQALEAKVFEKMGKYLPLAKELIESTKGAWYLTPAAKSHHDAVIGGLCYHSYKVGLSMSNKADIYELEDAPFAVFLATFHDYGKVLELDSKTLDYTQKGIVQSHITLGIRLMQTKKKLLDTCLTQHQQDLLFSVIEGHHGEDFGEAPKCLYAQMVYYEDIADARTTASIEFIRQKKATNEVDKSFYRGSSYFYVGGYEVK